MKALALVGSLGLFFASTALAEDNRSNEFSEDNNLWIEDGTLEKEGMTKDEFDHIIASAEGLYEQMAHAKGLSLHIRGQWDSSVVNAESSRFFWRARINMHGGLARRPEVSRDGFALVVCHELGHIFAGQPYAAPLVRLSAEGMSDYYAAGTCLKELLPLIPPDEPSAATQLSRSEQAKCRAKHGGNQADFAICLRQLAAAQSLANLLAAMKDVTPPSFTTPDSIVVSRTVRSYPETIQCRLDTYLAGTLEQPRPTCWYAEN